MRLLQYNISLRFTIMCLLCLQSLLSFSQSIIADASGKKNFKTIQAAINSLSDSSTKPRIVFIKNGIYNEKVFISKSNIILKGESREKNNSHTSYCKRYFSLLKPR